MSILWCDVRTLSDFAQWLTERDVMPTVVRPGGQDNPFHTRWMAVFAPGRPDHPLVAKLEQPYDDASLLAYGDDLHAALQNGMRQVDDLLGLNTPDARLFGTSLREQVAGGKQAREVAAFLRAAADWLYMAYELYRTGKLVELVDALLPEESDVFRRAVVNALSELKP